MRAIGLPADPRAIPSISHEGDSFVISDKFRYPIADMAAGVIITVTNTGNTGSVMSVLNVGLNTHGVYVCPTLTSGPTSGRAMKAALTMQNTTRALDLEGSVWRLNLTQRLELPRAPSAMTETDWNAVKANLLAFPRTKEMTARQFASPVTFTTNVVDTTAYHSYEQWAAPSASISSNLDAYWAHFAEWPGLTTAHRPMSTCVFYIGPQNVKNSWVATATVCNYTRWPMDTVPGRQSKPTPVASAQSVQQVHGYMQEAAETAFAGVAGFGAAAARFGARATPALEWAGEAALPLLGAPMGV